MPPLLGDHTVTYKFTDLLRFNLIAELPVKGVTFSKVASGVGPWAGTISVEDPGMRRANFGAATAVNKTAMWIDVDGVLIYGGMVTKRVYDATAGTIALSGSDFCQYAAMRLQAFDYENYTDANGREWAKLPGAPVLDIAFTILKQAFSVENSIPLQVVASGVATEESNWITFNAPIAQQQTLSAILSQLQELGFMVGIDYACDVAYVGGRPTATITLSYPRRGAQGKGPTTPIIDLANAAPGWTWEEDGTAQATAIIEQAGATSLRSSPGEWEPSVAEGYPLYEACVTHPALAPSESPATQLVAYLQGSLATNAFPYVIPSVTLPLFGDPSILSMVVGDNAVLRVTKASGSLPPSCPIFVDGLELLQRVTRMDCTIPDEGVPTMALTCNPPPSFQPALPVVWITGGPTEEPGREKEEERSSEITEEEVTAVKEEAELAERTAEEAEGHPEEGGPPYGAEAKLEAEHAREKAEAAKTAEQLAVAKAAAEAALIAADAALVEYKKHTLVVSVTAAANKKGDTIHFAGPKVKLNQKGTGTEPVAKNSFIGELENLLSEPVAEFDTSSAIFNNGTEPNYTFTGEGATGFTLTSNETQAGRVNFRVKI